MKEREFAAKHNLHQSVVVSLRKKHLMKGKDWFRDRRTAIWYDASVEKIETIMGMLSPEDLLPDDADSLPDDEEESPRGLVALIDPKRTPNPQFVRATINGEAVSVRCPGNWSARIRGKTVIIQKSEIDGDIKYIFDPYAK